MTTDTTDQEVEETRDLYALAAGRTALADGALEAFIVPAGAELHLEDTRPLAARPPRTRGTTTVDDVASWLAYLQRNADAAALEVHADVDEGTVTGILNAREYTPTGQPGWGDWRAVLALQRSPQWKAWKAIDGELLAQADFAQFIEDNLKDITSPAQADILEIAQSLTATIGTTAASASRLDSGAVGFQWTEDVSARAGRGTRSIEIPAALTLSIPVFRAADVWEIEARFRYRMTSSGLGLGVRLQRTDDLVEAAFDRVLTDIREDDVWKDDLDNPTIYRGPAPEAVTVKEA